MIDPHRTPSDEEFPVQASDSGSARELDTSMPAVPARPPEPISCWRCGKLAVASHRSCPYCHAPLLRDPQAPVRMKAAQDASAALIRTLIAFGIMLCISVIAGAILHGEVNSAPGQRPRSELEGLAITIGLEAIDTILVVAALCMVKIQYRGFSRTYGQKSAAWIGFLVLLGGLLILNVAYHHFLRSIAPVIEIPRHAFGDGMAFWLWGFVTCVQPAIVEELFFRYLTIGALRSVTGVHTAVWVSAAMFALAHIYVPLSLPILFCLGVALGYARVASGGMALPMFMHFLHNAIVMNL